MDNNDSYSTNVSSASDQDLLHEMMPKLGMETADDTGRYKSEARKKYFLPKLLILLLVIILIVSAVYVLQLPVRFQDVETTEAPDLFTVSFRLDRLPLLESVTASLDGHPLNVDLMDAGTYNLELDRNGELSIVARTLTDHYTDLNLTVDCIDEEPPHVERDEMFGKYLYIYLTDGEENSSGINWDSLQTTYADSGEHFEVTGVSKSFGYVRFVLPSQSVRIYVEDNNGNPLSLRLDPTPAA